MRYLYTVRRVDNSSQDYEEENYNLALDDFNENGVSITKKRLYYTVQNDPEGREFDQADDADIARNALLEPLQANVNNAYPVESHYVEVEG